MRTALLLLLIGTSAPVLAEPLYGDRPQAREERREARAAQWEAAREERADRVIRRRSNEEGAAEARLVPPAPSAGERPRPLERLRERFGGTERPDTAPFGRLERRRVAETVADAERASPGVRIIEAPEAVASERPRRPRLTRDSIAEAPGPAIIEAPRPSSRTREAVAGAPGPRMLDAPGTHRRTGDSVADWRLRDRGAGTAPQLVEERAGSTPESMRDPIRRRIERFVGGRDAPVVSREPREGTQPPAPAAQRRTRFVSDDWRGHWRRDRRYDWYNWRRGHRDRFHLGFYFDPFGWGYRRYSAGWRLWPAYYSSSSYWLQDAWYYRLPYAPPGYRWIRYYNDAVLVDTWDGRVADVIYNFFW